MLTLELRIDYPDERTARAVHAAVGPDNAGYVESELRGSSVVFRMESPSAGPLRSTADDLLACIGAAEGASGLVVPGPAADPDGDTLLE